MNKTNGSQLNPLASALNKKPLGFTLIEVLITVAIIGIIASVAYPSYLDSVLRSNRSEAQRELMRYANLQEQVYIDSRAYAVDMKGLGASTETIKTESKNYQIKVIASTATTFTLRAKARLVQEKDTGCLNLTINELGEKKPAICWQK